MTARLRRRALLALLFLCAPATSRDVIPPGKGVVPATWTVDLGPLAPSAYSEVEVGEGDTLSSIAARHLGDASRWEQIQALNPDVEATGLAVGQRLLLPPRDPDDPAHPPLHYFAMEEWLSLRAPVRVSHGRRTQCGKGWQRLVAVDDEHLPEFWKCFGTGEARRAWYQQIRLAKEPVTPAGLAVSEALPMERTLSDRDPAHRLKNTYHVRAIEGARIVVDVQTEKLGTATDASQKVPRDGDPPPLAATLGLPPDRDVVVPEDVSSRDGVRVLIVLSALALIVLTIRFLSRRGRSDDDPDR